MALVLQATSRESLAGLRARLDAYTDHAGAADLDRLGEDLFAVTRLLVAQRSLRRNLSDPGAPEWARTGLVRDLLGERICPQALDLVTAAAAVRWSRSIDLVEALELLARQAVLAVAEKVGGLDDVEDELFRFGRILNREPELTALLADEGAPAQGRAALLERLLAGKASVVTAALLRQTVLTPRGRHLDLAAEELAELAAARRERSIARVRASARLAPDQEQRLTASLTRLYGRPISLQIELDEGLLGGLVVTVGGEVIDGSVAGRLAAARRTLPS
ncbi:F0F1 ATP synthase subunit delta [Pseudonocardia hispaniensis]|uniref:ATP synthase subunit delta n=1 Tax=Pseudonocardia hispaniensis TaxID=904933 RepID=A0ABW1J742_9PSEU